MSRMKNSMSWPNKFICVKFRLSFSSCTSKIHSFLPNSIWLLFCKNLIFISKTSRAFSREWLKSGKSHCINWSWQMCKWKKESDVLTFLLSEMSLFGMKTGIKLSKILIKNSLYQRSILPISRMGTTKQLKNRSLWMKVFTLWKIIAI